MMGDFKFITLTLCISKIPLYVNIKKIAAYHKVEGATYTAIYLDGIEDMHFNVLESPNDITALMGKEYE